MRQGTKDTTDHNLLKNDGTQPNSRENAKTLLEKNWPMLRAYDHDCLGLCGVVVTVPRSPPPPKHEKQPLYLTSWHPPIDMASPLEGAGGVHGG